MLDAPPDTTLCIYRAGDMLKQDTSLCPVQTAFLFFSQKKIVLKIVIGKMVEY